MESRTKVILTFTILVFLIAALYIFTDWFSKTTGFSVGEDPDNELAKCLASNGSILYLSNSCPECSQQKSLFGTSAFKFLNVIECENNPKCSEIKAFPAWKINNTIFYGLKTTKQLREISGCND